MLGVLGVLGVRAQGCAGSGVAGAAEDVLRIEHRLDAVEQIDPHRVAVGGKRIVVGRSPAVFGGPRSTEAGDHRSTHPAMSRRNRVRMSVP